jgi:hypothetical protein
MEDRRYRKQSRERWARIKVLVDRLEELSKQDAQAKS